MNQPSSFSRCLPYGAASTLLGVVACLVWARAHGVALGLPLDDAWIHAAFARHLANEGIWGLFAGVPSGGESSLLWPFLLLPGELFGSSASPRLALLLGVACFVSLAALLGGLGSTQARGRLIAVVTGLCGPLLFLSLSGMENLPALTAGVASLYCFSRNRRRAAVLLAGLAGVLRPEAVLLLGVLLVGLLDAAKHRGERRRDALVPSLRVLSPGLAIWVLGLVALSLLDGHFPPATLGGRRWILGLSPDLSLTRLGSGSAPFLIGWARFLVADLGMGRVLHAHPFAGSAFLAWLWKLSAVFVLVTGLISTLRRAAGHESRAVPRLLIVWTVWVLFFFALVLPSRGHVGRYQPQVYIVVIVLAVEGCASLIRRGGRVGMGGWLAAAILSTGLLMGWSRIPVLWTGAVDHMARVHLRAAGDLSRVHEGPPATRVGPIGVFDVGAMAYLYEGEMVDLSGLSDPEIAAALQHAQEGAVARLVLRERTELVLLPVWDLDGPGSLRDRLGLTAENGIWLEPVRRWESTEEDWGPSFAFSGNVFRQLWLYEVSPLDRLDPVEP